jgi:dihydrofolate reductase
MRSLVVIENITVDGVIDAGGDWFAPSGAAGTADVADMRRVEESHRDAADALLVGRNTFEAFRGYWPHQRDDTTGISAYLDAVEKYVVSSTLDEPRWDRSHILRGPLVDDFLAPLGLESRDLVDGRR